MSIKFIHTADWQLGKPYANVGEVDKRSRLQHERVAVIERIGVAARKHGATFVLVAGDLFDSPTATQSTVSAACHAIRALDLPVYAIPGNHDHGAPGSLWTQEFFIRECSALAPNFRVLLKPEPVELDDVILLPCPLLRRHDARDPTEWLRSICELGGRFGGRPRVVIAHGSVQNFTSADDDDGGDVANQIDLERLPASEIDYVALGDWHGMKPVGPKAWYSGTPELDRFSKGEDNRPGFVLAVTASRNEVPHVVTVPTAKIGWYRETQTFADDAGIALFEERLNAQLGAEVGQAVLQLELHGSLGIDAMTRLEHSIEAWIARLLHVRIENRVVVAPTPAEIEAMTMRTSDPLIASVATKLVAMCEQAGEPGEVARLALRRLHAACVGR
ncbi:MAG: DNA repair exonuclease [Planctomycetes bacterium]|nr:DNA repair exonuclease [Planctomycetota bacterium]